MRGRLLNISAIARAAGFAAVAVTIIVAGLHFVRHTASAYERVHWTAPHADTLAESLTRCGTLDSSALKAEREACEAAWAENRRRFFGDESAGNITSLRAGDLQPIAKPEGR
jgi:conjugative transfer region protein TrbK